MKHILLLVNNSSMKEQLEQKLNSNEDIHVNCFENLDDMNLFLSFQPTIDLIFYSLHFDQDEMINKFKEDTSQVVNDQSGILTCNHEIIENIKTSIYIHPQLPADKVVHIIRKALNIESKKYDENDYKCIAISACIGMKEPPCDLYVKIGNGGNFVKRFNSKEKIDLEDLRNFTQGYGIKLYIAKDDTENFDNYLRKTQKNLKGSGLNDIGTSKSQIPKIHTSLELSQE